MTGSLPLILVLSLIFGAGQVMVGGGLAWRTLSNLESRREWRSALLLCVWLWFVVSGVIELFVSGMEASQRLTGAPTAAMFTLWRGRADTTLYVASAILAVCAVIGPLALRWQATRRVGAAGDTVDAASEGDTGR